MFHANVRYIQGHGGLGPLFHPDMHRLTHDRLAPELRRIAGAVNVTEDPWRLAAKVTHGGIPAHAQFRFPKATTLQTVLITYEGSEDDQWRLRAWLCRHISDELTRTSARRHWVGVNVEAELGGLCTLHFPLLLTVHYHSPVLDQ